jgi:hypothetical protein
MRRKRPEVLGVDLNRSGSSRQPVCPRTPARQLFAKAAIMASRVGSYPCVGSYRATKSISETKVTSQLVQAMARDRDPHVAWFLAWLIWH